MEFKEACALIGHRSESTDWSHPTPCLLSSPLLSSPLLSSMATTPVRKQKKKKKVLHKTEQRGSSVCCESLEGSDSLCASGEGGWSLGIRHGDARNHHVGTGTFITFRQRTSERGNCTSNVAQQVSPLVQTGYRGIKKKKDLRSWETHGV